MNSHSQKPSTATHEQIALRAYELWEKRGRPFGHESENWLAAESDLMSETNAARKSEAASSMSASRTIPEKEEVPLSARMTSQNKGEESSSRNSLTPKQWATNERENFIVLSDRGHLRIYADERAEDRSERHLVLAESLDFPDGVHSYTSRNADQAGRFPGADGTAGGMSIDERLPLQRQRDHTLAKTIAGQISSFMRSYPSARWCFAAGPALHRLVLEELDNTTKANLSESLNKDLVNEPVARLRSHFSRLPT